MTSVLSTKILEASKKNHLLHAGMGLVEYDAIQIQLQPPLLESNPVYTGLVFSSKHGFYAFIESFRSLAPEKQKHWDLPVYCVGETTASIIKKEGFSLENCYENARLMAEGLKLKSKDRLAYFSGNLRLDYLPETLKKAGVALEERQVYHTVLTPKMYGRRFDAVLFFSPSGVRSHLSRNNLDGAIPFCIGETTAQEISNYTKKYFVAKKPSIDSLLIKTINHFKRAQTT